MRTKLLYTLIILAMVFSFLIPFATPAFATTDTYTGDTSDAYWYKANPVYATARNAIQSGYAAQVDATTLKVGQVFEDSVYSIYRGSIIVDTADIPDTATISSAVVKVWGAGSFQSSAYSVVLTDSLSYTGTEADYPGIPSIAIDYNLSYYDTTTLGYINSGSWSNSGWNTITLNATGIARINKTGMTKFFVRSSHDIGNTVYASQNTVEFYSGNKAGYEPKIEVTYTVAGSIVAPTVTTVYADSETETSARLVGYLTSNGGEDCMVRFEYGTTGSYGSYTAWQGYYTTGNYIYATISGLTKGELYYFRAVASNSGGTGNGAQDIVLTYPAAPSNLVITPSSTQNALSWTAGDGADASAVRFSLTNYPQTITDGTEIHNDAGVTHTHGSLTNGLTYYYTLWSYATEGGKSKYSYGAISGYGQPVALATATVSTLAATAVGTTTATLNGRLSSLGGYGTVDVSFQYYTGAGTWTDHVTTPVTKSATCDFYADITTLSAASLYNFRVKATSGAGTVYSSGLTFTTGGYSAPTMTTGAASDITKTTVKLNGTVTADGGVSVTAYFEWGLTTSYGFTSTTVAGLTTGSTMYLNLGELTPGTTYHYRIVGTNSAGTAYGGDVSFVTTAPELPTVITNAATSVGSNTAILSGLLQTDGSATCEVQFQWFEQGGSWATATPTGWQTGKISGNTFTYSLGGLTIGRTYYYRAQAKNATGTASGATQYFATTFTAPTNFDATALTSASIKLTWTKQGDNTYIVMKPTGYPTSRTDGTMIYFGTGVTTTLSTGLEAGKNYYFSAWSWREGDVFSATYSQTLATTLASSISGTDDTGVLVPPDRPSGWFAAPNYIRMSDFPLYPSINLFADSMSIPRGTFWLLGMLGLAVLLGVIAFFLFGHSVMAAIIVMALVMLLGFLAGLTPLWMLIVIVIFCIMVVIIGSR
jgi:hypothetical protein